MSASSASPPAPLFVLRGHRAPVHTVAFAEADAPAVTAAASASSALVAGHRAAPALAAVTHGGAGPSHCLWSGDATGCLMRWNLRTRRSDIRIAAHGAPVLAIHALSDGRVLSQGKDGFVKVWDLGGSTTEPLHTIETNSYTFFKMQVAEQQPRARHQTIGPESASLAISSAPSVATSSSPSMFSTSPLLLLPCEIASNLDLFDLRASTSRPVQTVECEARVPRDPSLEESFRSRLSDQELEEVDALLASQPPQYERKVGMVMAARFFDPTATDATGAATADDAPPPPPSMDRLNIAWASESGIVGVWDIRAAKHRFQQTLHKDTILSFDVNWSGKYGVSCSSGSDILAWSIDTIAGCVHEMARINVPHEGLAEVVLRDDGRLFATGGWDHRVRLFDCSTLQPLTILREHTDTVQCVAMPSQRHDPRAAASTGYLASGAKDGKIAVYQLYADANQQQLITTGAMRSDAGTVVHKHQQIFAARQAALEQPTPQPIQQLL